MTGSSNSSCDSMNVSVVVSCSLTHKLSRSFLFICLCHFIEFCLFWLIWFGLNYLFDYLVLPLAWFVEMSCQRFCSLLPIKRRLDPQNHHLCIGYLPSGVLYPSVLHTEPEWKNTTTAKLYEIILFIFADWFCIGIVPPDLILTLQFFSGRLVLFFMNEFFIRFISLNCLCLVPQRSFSQNIKVTLIF